MSLIKCTECGEMISDKAKSCPRCGYPIQSVNHTEIAQHENAAPDITAQREKERRELLAQLKRVRQCVGKIETLVQRKEEIEEKISSNKRAKDFLSDSSMKGKVFCFTFFPIAIVMILLLCLCVDAVGGESEEGAMVLGLIIAGILEILIMKAYTNWVANSYQNFSYQESKREIEKELKEYCSQPQVSSSLAYLPKQYWDCVTIDYLIDVIHNRRADQLKEAINLYEDYLHKAKVEAMQNKQLAATENLTTMMGGQMQRMEELSQITKSADRAAKLSAIVSVLK